MIISAFAGQGKIIWKLWQPALYCETRLTELRGPLRIQHNLWFSQVQQFQVQNQYGSTTLQVRYSVTGNILQFSFSKIWIWISILVDRSMKYPNWPRRWMLNNRDKFDYGLDEINFSYSTLQVISTSILTFTGTSLSCVTPRRGSVPRRPA